LDSTPKIPIKRHIPLHRLIIKQLIATQPGKTFPTLWNHIKEDEMGRTCSTNVAKRNTYRILVGKPEGKTPLERLRRGLVYNIKIDLKRERGWDGMD
jgi:hypothetical protein